ncbi:MAG: hypothetical protein ROR55_06705 [Devosia sp.]
MLTRIRLELARDKDAPMGSPNRGYVFVAPLDNTDHLDPVAWEAHANRCVVTRFWDGETTELGTLVHHKDDSWAFDYDPEDEDDDEPGFRFAAHPFRPGEYVSIREHDGVMRTFRVASVEAMPD